MGSSTIQKRTIFIMKSCVVILLCFVCTLANGQILNIEKRRLITDTTGWSGTLSASISASQYTRSFFSSGANGNVQLKSGDNLYLLYGGITFVNGGGDDFNNAGFGHLRYNRKINEVLRLELFTQIQYNSLTKITSRILNGGGIRLKLSEYETAKFYYGLTYMYEHEELKQPELINKDHRLSSYLTFTLTPVETIRFRNTTYVQPKFGDVYDYRLSNDTSMSFKINKHLRLTTNFHYLYDSRPPVEVPSINYEITNGLTFAF